MSCRNSDCQFSNVEEKNCGKKSDQVNACPCCSASFRSLIIWKMNCPAHDKMKKRPVTRPNEYALVNFGLAFGMTSPPLLISRFGGALVTYPRCQPSKHCRLCTSSD